MIQFKYIDLLNEMVDKGFVSVQKHPQFNYFIYNYTAQCTWAKKWNEATMQARGLILDGNGMIIAKPFPKFWNMEEYQPEDIPWDQPHIVYEKVDGSLGIPYVGEDGKVYFATRGSFVSEQAMEANKILDKYSISPYIKSNADRCTFLFEIVYPENRIVVDYGTERKLVLLGGVNYENGDNFLSPEDTKMVKHGTDIPYAKRFTGIDLNNKIGEPNTEGYVVRFKNGFTMKVKLSEYVRLHGLLTNFSNLDIWRCLRAGDSIADKLVDVPDEFYDWVVEQIGDLQFAFNDTITDAELLRNKVAPDNSKSRKEIAALLKNEDPFLASLVFGMLDNKNISEQVWRHVRPKYQKPFYQNKNDNN